MTLHYYFAYGFRLSSTIPIPELRPAEPGPVRWNFSVVDELADMEDPELLGEEPIYGAVSARLFRHAGGSRIRIHDTGDYDLPDGASEIRWRPNADPWWDFGRSHLIGRVLATALQFTGVVTLHASAVQMADGVVGFLAPKHHGKSTLAMMLFRSGARFVTDDSLPIRTDRPILALPGIQSLRVRAGDQGGERLLGEVVAGTPGRDGKIFLEPFPLQRVMNAPGEVSALYFLKPVPPGTAHAAERTRVPSVPASIRLLSDAKIGAMLGSGFAPALLESTGSIASSVPIYDLRIVRDLDQLPAVVEQLVTWHGLPDQATEA